MSDRARGGFNVEDTVSVCSCEGHILIVAEPVVASVLRTQCPHASHEGHILIVSDRTRGGFSIEDTVSMYLCERQLCDSDRARGNFSVEDTVSMCSCGGHHSDSGRVRGDISVEDIVFTFSCKRLHSDNGRARGSNSVKDTVSTCSCEGHIPIVTGPEMASVLRTQCLCEVVAGTQKTRLNNPGCWFGSLSGLTDSIGWGDACLPV